MTWLKAHMMLNPQGARVYNLAAKLNLDHVAYLIKSEINLERPWYACATDGAEFAIDECDQGIIDELTWAPDV